MGAGAALPGESPDGLPEAEAPVCTIGQDFDGSCLRAVRAGRRPRAVARRAPPQPHRRGDGHARPRCRRGRGRPLLQLRLRRGELVRPGARADRARRSASRPRAGSSTPRTSSRWASTRARCWRPARWCWRCRCRQPKNGATLHLHQVRHPQVHRLLRRQLRRGDRDGRRRRQVRPHLPQLGVRAADEGAPRPSGTWWARRSTRTTAEQAADAGHGRRLRAPQQPVQDPDSPNAGEASHTGLRLGRGTVIRGEPATRGSTIR